MASNRGISNSNVIPNESGCYTEASCWSFIKSVSFSWIMGVVICEKENFITRKVQHCTPIHEVEIMMIDFLGELLPRLLYSIVAPS